MAHQAHRIEPERERLVIEGISVRECDCAFCANPRCVLHVNPGDVNIKGNGNWAETPDGIITGRQRVHSVLLCDRCAARVARGELTVQRDCAA